MGAMQRNKGCRGELEIAAILADLTGYNVKRRVRNHDNDSDLDGIPGWSIEVKRAAKPLVSQWWRQAARQARKAGMLPVLFYRIDRHDWRAIWPLSAAIGGDWDDDIKWTCESSIDAWVSVMLEVALMEVV